MARRGAKKSGVLTLRIPPGLHADLALTAAELGLDLSGLIRLMIRRSLPHFQLEARLLAVQGEEADQLFAGWRRQNPARPVREFWDDYFRHQRVAWALDLRKQGFDPRFTVEEADKGGDPFAGPASTTEEHP